MVRWTMAERRSTGPWWTMGGGAAGARQRRGTPAFPCVGPHRGRSGSKRKRRGSSPRSLTGGAVM
jgi:hypothetical protein